MACGGAMVYWSHGDQRAGRHARSYRDFDAVGRVSGAHVGDCPAVTKYAAAPPVGYVYLVFPRDAAAGATAVLVQHVDVIPACRAGYSVRPGIYELEYQ